jgi:hypothetical protein
MIATARHYVCTECTQDAKAINPTSSISIGDWSIEECSKRQKKKILRANWMDFIDQVGTTCNMMHYQDYFAITKNE